MKMLDPNKNEIIKTIHLYLSEPDAIELVEALNRLLDDPEANNHFHLYSEDLKTELSCSIVTDQKLIKNKYTELERKILTEI